MSDYTVFIPVAPMPSHPSGDILDETLASIRERLPDSEIILMFDAPAPFLMHLKKAYDKYVEKMLWRCAHEFTNVTPVVFKEWSHQSSMIERAIKLCRTPLMLMNEQDTPLVGDIPFTEMTRPLLAGYSNVIRLYSADNIVPEHKYLMLDDQIIDVMGTPLQRTRQWSGWPHLARVDFYEHIISKYWKPVMFIEHFMYGIVEGGDWAEFRLHIYSPEGSILRHAHLDGRRKGAAEYDPNPS